MDVNRLLNRIYRLNKAEKYEDVIKSLSQEQLILFHNANLYAEKALAFWRIEMYNECSLAVESALKIDPDNAKANYYKGNLLSEEGKYKEAITYYRKSIVQDPLFAYPYDSLGEIFQELGQYDDAIEAYKKAIEIEPSFFNPYHGLGDIYSTLKKYDKAIDSYRNAIAIGGAYSAISYNNLGIIYCQQKRHSEAIDAYEAAIDIDRYFAYPHNNLGILYFDEKKYDKALTAYKKAIKIDAEFADSYYNIGLLYFTARKYKDALTAFEKYVAYINDKEEVYSKLALSKIEDIRQMLESPEYRQISELVTKIKSLLLFEEACVTHYTSLSVAKELLLKNSPLRLSEGAFLNDTSEGRELFKFLASAISSTIEKKDDTIARPFSAKPFIGSFVADTKHDDLTLWRMYGKEAKEEAKGCAITLKRALLLNNLKQKLAPLGNTSNTDEEFSFYRVAYRSVGNGKKGDSFVVPGIEENKTDMLNRYMKRLLVNIQRFNFKEEKTAERKEKLLSKLNDIAYLFKSAEYQYEHELRLVVNSIVFEKEINEIFIPPRVYVDLVSITTLVQKITLGPKVERAEEWAAGLYYAFEKEKLYPEIYISCLPFK